MGASLRSRITEALSRPPQRRRDRQHRHPKQRGRCMDWKLEGVVPASDVEDANGDSDGYLCIGSSRARLAAV